MEVVSVLGGPGVHARAALPWYQLSFPLEETYTPWRFTKPSQIAGKERGVSLLSPLIYHAPLSQGHYALKSLHFFLNILSSV